MSSVLGKTQGIEKNINDPKITLRPLTRSSIIRVIFCWWSNKKFSKYLRHFFWHPFLSFNGLMYDGLYDGYDGGGRQPGPPQWSDPPRFNRRLPVRTKPLPIQLTHHHATFRGPALQTASICKPFGDEMMSSRNVFKIPTTIIGQYILFRKNKTRSH